VVLLALSAAALVARRVSPVGVWAAVCALTVGMVLAGAVDPTTAAPLLVALYTVGRLEGLRTTSACVLASAASYAVALAVSQGTWLDERGDSPALPVLALAGAAAAVGVAVRGQHDALEAARARARQAELTREEEAVRRVTDERVRIARELHDVLAHHISVINVQAGVARHLLDTRPDQARTALTAVRDASKTVLTEMAAVLGLLRTEDGAGPAEPAPGLHRLPALVDSLRSAGLDVTWRTTGEARILSPIAELAAYRVVQESLTNALKYGTGTAQLLVGHDPQEVVVEVRNPVADPSSSGPAGGHGLIGMRERVDAVAGRLTAGPDSAGGWSVRAVIPRDPR
jgi:signal transduction histidine kinase